MDFLEAVAAYEADRLNYSKGTDMFEYATTWQEFQDAANRLDVSVDPNKTLVGFSGKLNGTHSTVLLRDLVDDFPNQYTSIYDTFAHSVLNSDVVNHKVKYLPANDPLASGLWPQEIMEGTSNLNGGNGLFSYVSKNLFTDFGGKEVIFISPYADSWSTLNISEVTPTIENQSIEILNGRDKSLLPTVKGDAFNYIKETSALYILENTSTPESPNKIFTSSAAEKLLGDSEWKDTHANILNNPDPEVKASYFNAIDGLKNLGHLMLPIGVAFTVVQIFKADAAHASGDYETAAQIYNDLVVDMLGEAYGSIYALALASAVAGATLPIYATVAIGILGAVYGADFLEWVGETVTDIYNTTTSELNAAVDSLSEHIISFTALAMIGAGLLLDPIMTEIANFMKALGLEKFYDPIILDMDSDGIELISVANSNVQFDFDKDGFNEKAGWVAPDDAFLVWDKNGNGQIDDIDEMFGNETISGFDELRPHTGVDHKLSAADAIYTELRLWNDLNSDGIVDAGELRTLAEAGVVELYLNPTEKNIVEKGNIIADVSTWSDGTNTHQVADVEFLLEQVNSLPQADATGIELTLEAVLAPHSRGYGNMLSLQHAISSNPDLADKVYELMALAPEDFHLAFGLVEEVLYEWAGTTDVATDSRGPLFDGRKLATIEAVTGEPMVLFDGSTDPLIGSQVQLNATWNMLMNMFQERLLVQGPMRELFPDASYDFMTDTLSLGGDSGALLANAMSVESNDDMQEYWFKFLDIVIEHDRKEFEGLTPEQLAALPNYWEGGMIIKENPSANYEATPDPWNKYESGFKQEFVDLIKEKLNIDLNDIDNDGIADETDANGHEYFFAAITSSGSGNSTPVDTSAKDIAAVPAADFQETDDFILGGYGPDAIHGYGGNDILYGGTGNDFLYGYDGHNYMFGGAGDDVIQSAEGGVDVIFGNDGNDEFKMYGHSHTVDGGKGDDTYRVGGNVSYIWGMDDGNDRVLSFNYGAGTEQKLFIDDGLTDNEIRMDVYGNSLEVINDVTGETFSFLLQSGSEIDEVHFDDGTVWDLAAGAEFRAHATEATDVGGYIGNDTMLGGTGNDILRGNGGVDTYIHEVGGGNDTLAGGYDDQEIVLMNGVANDDLYFNVSGGYNLLVTDAATGENLTLSSQYYQTHWGYEFGTVNGVNVLGGLTIKGTSATAGENLYGTTFADTMIGGLGDDGVYSGLGQDIFIHEVGDGNDHLNGGGTNDLDIVLMNGVANDDLYFNVSTVNANNLLVTDTATGETLTLDNIYYQTNYGYEFSTVNGIDVTGGLTIKGTSASLGENLYGTTFADTMIGGLGNDTIRGGTGQDTFIHEVGDGNDHLYGGSANDLNIVLMNGVATADLYFNVSVYDLIVTDNATGEQITLDNMYHYENYGYEFGTVNGVDVTGSLFIQGDSNITGASQADTMQGGTSSDVYRGGNGDDILIASEGSDLLYGQGGADTFVFDDVTKSTSTGTSSSIKDFVSGTDIIDLSDIATIDELSDLTLYEVGNKTYVSDNNSDFYFAIEGSSAIGLDETDFIFV